MDTKRPVKKIGTHNGRFHADEVMATAVLKEIFDIEITRTRKPEILNKLDIVYDVGGGEFDHHDVEKVYRENGTPYASCGLIWNKFGREVIMAKDPQLSEEEAYSIFRSIDTALMQGIDAADNGLSTGDTVIPIMNISSIISGFNPPWYSEISDDIAFGDAVSFASAVLDNTLNQKFSVVKARGNVVRAFENRPRREVLALDVYCPWSRILREVDKAGEVLYAVYPSREGYAIQTVREKAKNLKAKKDLPKSWAGKRDEELGEIIGINDAVFCHPGRFIAGARSLDSIMKMADIAINEPPEKFIKRIIWKFKRFFLGR